MSEVLSLALPAIFIPSPYVANNHQYYNALEIKNNNAGELIEEKELTSKKLDNMINNVLFDEKRYKEMKKNLKKLSIDNSSEIIYKRIKDLVECKKN